MKTETKFDSWHFSYKLTKPKYKKYSHLAKNEVLLDFKTIKMFFFLKLELYMQQMSSITKFNSFCMNHKKKQKSKL